MGRRPDSPEDQKAKGYPGKRRSKTDRLIADAERRAQLLAAAPAEGGDLLSPPKLIEDPQLVDALWIWRRLVPQLREQNLFAEVDRLSFAMYCVYQAEYFRANQEVLAKGHVIMAKATAGGLRPWTNPAVKIRDNAANMALELAKRFGLTPLDRAVLEHRNSTAAAGPLFRREIEDAPAPSEDETPKPQGNAIGLLDSFDSTPPGARPN